MIWRFGMESLIDLVVTKISALFAFLGSVVNFSWWLLLPVWALCVLLFFVTRRLVHRVRGFFR